MSLTERRRAMMMSQTSGQAYFDFTPPSEYGRSTNGGVTALLTYLNSVLPTGWCVAKVYRPNSTNVQQYELAEIGLSKYGTVESANRYQNGAVTLTSFGYRPAEYSVIVFPNTTYRCEYIMSDYNS